MHAAQWKTKYYLLLDENDLENGKLSQRLESERNLFSSLLIYVVSRVDVLAVTGVKQQYKEEEYYLWLIRYLISRRLFVQDIKDFKAPSLGSMNNKKNEIIQKELNIVGLVNENFTSGEQRIKWYRQMEYVPKDVNIPGIICVDACYFN